jgi:hemolysin activation/secretion protein
MRASFQVGNKKIKPSNSILNLKSDDFSYASLYDSIDAKSLQMLVRWTFNAYLPLSKRNIVKLGIQGQALINDNLLDNELLRIGGNKLLRGFDEEALFVAHYNILTAEYRFILEQNSYMYAFVDAAYTGRTRDGKYQKDFPLGFGAGMAFETKAGIFGISYALGRQTDVPLDFRSSKIHFGYVNIF